MDNIELHNLSIFQSQNKKLETAEEVLDALRKEAAENNCKWLEENLEVSMEAVKEKRGVR
jgi:hypothetical protein